MSILREIGIIARALDSIANIEFRDLDLAWSIPLPGANCRATWNDSGRTL